jgi:hypothetical protein
MDKGRVRGDGVVEELLALRIGAKVDGPGGRNAHKVWAEALKKGPRPLVFHNVPQTLDEAHARSQRRGECHGCGEIPAGPEGPQGPTCAAVGAGDDGRTEVAGRRLKSRLHHLEGARGDGPRGARHPEKVKGQNRGRRPLCQTYPPATK